MGIFAENVGNTVKTRVFPIFCLPCPLLWDIINKSWKYALTAGTWKCVRSEDRRNKGKDEKVYNVRQSWR